MINNPQLALIVDDEEDILELLKCILSAHGFEPFAARDGREALGLWEEHEGRFDVLVTDVGLSGQISGQDLAARLTARSPFLKVLLITGYAEEDLKLMVAGEQNFKILTKPFSLNAFMEAIGELELVA